MHILGILVKVCLFVCYAFKKTKQGEDADDDMMTTTNIP